MCFYLLALEGGTLASVGGLRWEWLETVMGLYGCFVLLKGITLELGAYAWRKQESGYLQR